MNYVNTVTGPVAASELGRTLMHEHFLFGFCGFQGDATLGGFKEEEYTRDCLKAVDDARAYGINTIVDATTNECGRNVRFLKKISDMTGMNIICSTGYYFQAESAYAYWNFRRGFANIEEEIYEMMVTELTKGIEGTKPASSNWPAASMKSHQLKKSSSKPLHVPRRKQAASSSHIHSLVQWVLNRHSC